MDRDSLKRCGVRILVLSRGRSRSISGNTLSLLPEWVEVVVPRSQSDSYREEIPNDLIETPDTVLGLGRLRNWVLDNIRDEVVVMLDDDIHAIYELTKPRSRRIVDPDEVAHVIANDAVCARDAGVSVFSYNQKDIRSYAPHSPFNLCTWVGTVVGVVGRNHRFMDDAFKVDVDFSLQCLMHERAVWVDNRYYFYNIKNAGTGGNSSLRTERGFNESLEKVKSKWGSYVKVTRHKSDTGIALNVKRKQDLKYD